MTQPAKKRTCARCGHHGYPAASFPEGHLCWRCLTTALAVAGTCPGCGAAGRVLPGLRDGVRICRDCAGITRDFSLPAVRHRNRHGLSYPAVAEAALRPVRGDLDGRPAAG